jgi:hypothetical protein
MVEMAAQGCVPRLQVSACFMLEAVLEAEKHQVVLLLLVVEMETLHQRDMVLMVKLTQAVEVVVLVAQTQAKLEQAAALAS